MIASLVSAPMIALNAQSAVAGYQDFRLHNNTPFTIERVYVTPSSSTTWGQDVLGVNVLPGGHYTVINFYGNSNVCLFDIKVIFVDGSYLRNSGFNLCRLTDVSIP